MADENYEDGDDQSARKAHKKWTRELQASEKRFKRFIKQGNGVVERYLDRKGGGSDEGGSSPTAARRLNLFHTNISTTQAMLFGSTPNVEVTREHHDPDDDVARVACLMYQRMLQADIQPSGSDLPTVLKAALQDRLLPGLGVARVRYDYEAETLTAMDATENGIEEVEYEQVTDERAPVDYVHWQDVRWGWCRTWSELPWLGFRAWMSKEEFKERFGEEDVDQVQFTTQLPGGTKDETSQSDSDEKNNVEQAQVWEIWDKKTRKVYWHTKGVDKCLDIQDDPLELDGFWPCPRFMIANQSTSLLEPTADFIIAQDLYNQIDTLYTRISIITHAIKVVGVYDEAAGNSVGRMLDEGMENDLIPVDNWAMFAEKGGLKGSIDWFPVQDVVQTLATLRQILGETIELLYQVTGMSDVLRGANTDQYTSDGTNQLKAKFGSIRVQALQDEFARFASELEELKAEVVSKHFEPKSIVKHSAAMYLPEPDRQYVMPALELIKSPDVKFRVNIRPESIAMVDYAQLKSERTEFLTAMATFVQSAQAAASTMPGATPILLEMMKWGMAGFKGANYLEGIMDQAIDMAKKAQAEQQGNQEPSPEQIKRETEQIKAQAAAAKTQGELQKVQAKAAADMGLLQTKLAGEMQKLREDASLDGELEQARFQQRMAEVMREFQNDMQRIQAQLQADVTVEEAQSTFAMAEETQEHANNLEQIRAQGRRRDG